MSCCEYHSVIKHVHGELVFPDYFARFHIISQRGSSTGGLPNLAMEQWRTSGILYPT